MITSILLTYDLLLSGLSLQDILSEVHLYVHRLELPPRVKIQLLIKLATHKTILPRLVHHLTDSLNNSPA